MWLSSSGRTGKTRLHYRAPLLARCIPSAAELLPVPSTWRGPLEPVLGGDIPRDINSFNPSLYAFQDFGLLKVVDEPYPGLDKECNIKPRLAPGARDRATRLTLGRMTIGRCALPSC